VQFPDIAQSSNLFWNLNEFVVSDGQDPQIDHVLDFGRQELKIIVTVKRK